MLCIILTSFEIVTISKSEMIENVASNDIILIQNLIFSSESFKHTESWVPICLPGISDCGYLQMYTNFFEANFGVVFITESQEHSYFLKFAEQSRNIYQSTVDENLLAMIKFAFNHKTTSINSNGVILNRNKKSYMDILNDEDKLVEEFLKNLNPRKSTGSVNNLPNNQQKRSSTVLSQNQSTTSIDPFEDVKFLMCKNKVTNQFFTFRFNAYNGISHIEKNVMKCYSNLYDVYTTNNLPLNSNNFFYYEKGENMTHTIHTNENYVLFASFNLFEEYDTIFNLSTEILKIIKYKESHFFITKY